MHQTTRRLRRRAKRQRLCGDHRRAYATTTRGLAGLVRLGVLVRTSDHKSTRYSLNVTVETLKPVEPGPFRQLR